jgi:hypothetical protein
LDLPRSGRQEKLTAHAKAVIQRHMLDRWGASERKTAKIINQTPEYLNVNMTVSRSTVRNYLQTTDWGRVAYHQQIKPLLTEKNIRDRLTFCSTVSDMGYCSATEESMELLRHVLFTDEAPICLNAHPNRQNYRIRTLTENNRRIACPRISTTLMVAGGMSYYGLTELHIVDHRSTVTGDYYRTKILPMYIKTTEQHVANGLFPKPSMATFQQDGAPSHTAKLTMDLLVQSFPRVWGKNTWPGNSPDLNPIEHLWAILQDSVFEHPCPRNRQELIERVQPKWQSISSSLLRNLVTSFPRRVFQCQANNGKHTSY